MNDIWDILHIIATGVIALITIYNFCKIRKNDIFETRKKWTNIKEKLEYLSKILNRKEEYICYQVIKEKIEFIKENYSQFRYPTQIKIDTIIKNIESLELDNTLAIDMEGILNSEEAKKISSEIEKLISEDISM